MLTSRVLTMRWSSISAEPRYHERRASGRKQASPGVVIRGAVRVVASVASRQHPFSGPELCPTDLTRWRTLRNEARRLQYRFRKSPEQYLADLEEKLPGSKDPSVTLCPSMSQSELNDFYHD